MVAGQCLAECRREVPAADQPPSRKAKCDRNTPVLPAISFVLAIGAMIAAYFDKRVVLSILFLRSILLLLGSMLLFTREVQIANPANDVHLSDVETYQEWEQYLKPKRRRSGTTKT